MPGRDQELLIILAPPGPNSAEFSGTLLAQKHRVCSCSKVAAALAAQEGPSGRSIWDISCLRVAGQPVQRATVVAWLNRVYRAISSCDYEEQPNEPHTAAQLIELLAFADAVDTERGILLACLTGLEDLVIRSSMSQPVQLHTDGRSYSFDGMQLCCATAAGSIGQVGYPAGSLQDQQQLSADVAEQLEQLLFFGHSMQLQPLIQHLHAFLASNATDPTNTALLYGVLDLVFSHRVITAALGPAAAADQTPAGAAKRREWISSVLAQPLGFVAGTSWSQQLLKPLLPPKLLAPLQFSAELLQDWWGCRKGDTVPVTLDLFDSSTMTVGGVARGVQLLLGPAATARECDHKRLMSSRLAAETLP